MAKTVHAPQGAPTGWYTSRGRLADALEAGHPSCRVRVGSTAYEIAKSAPDITCQTASCSAARRFMEEPPSSDYTTPVSIFPASVQEPADRAFNREGGEEVGRVLTIPELDDDGLVMGGELQIDLDDHDPSRPLSVPLAWACYSALGDAGDELGRLVVWRNAVRWWRGLE